MSLLGSSNHRALYLLHGRCCQRYGTLVAGSSSVRKWANAMTRHGELNFLNAVTWRKLFVDIVPSDEMEKALKVERIPSPRLCTKEINLTFSKIKRKGARMICGIDRLVSTGRIDSLSLLDVWSKQRNRNKNNTVLLRFDTPAGRMIPYMSIFLYIEEILDGHVDARDWIMVKTSPGTFDLYMTLAAADVLEKIGESFTVPWMECNEENDSIDNDVSFWVARTHSIDDMTAKIGEEKERTIAANVLPSGWTLHDVCEDVHGDPITTPISKTGTRILYETAGCDFLKHLQLLAKGL